MRNTILAIVGVLLLFGAYWAGTLNRETAPAIREIKTMDPVNLMHLQSEKTFKGAGWEVAQNVVNSYENHYSVSKGKCFVLTNIFDARAITVDGTTTNSQSLDD